MIEENIKNETTEETEDIPTFHEVAELMRLLWPFYFGNSEKVQKGGENE